MDRERGYFHARARARQAEEPTSDRVKAGRRGDARVCASARAHTGERTPQREIAVHWPPRLEQTVVLCYCYVLGERGSQVLFLCLCIAGIFADADGIGARVLWLRVCLRRFASMHEGDCEVFMKFTIAKI